MDDIDFTLPGPRPGEESPSRGERSKPSTIWQPPSPEELQAQISAYKILDLLGRGGMGAVYKGWQVSLERYVAIKFLPPNMEDDDEAQFAERFKREAKTMAKFLHPGIVAVFDAGETASGLLYIVMEFVEGTDVAQMVKSEGRLPPEQALAITMHVCDALQYAHSHGVMHRDIKPANIMVNREGQVKVADFGLAKTSGAAQYGLTHSNMSLGTPDYMAPESLITDTLADHRADLLYAVGVMLYDMLTGEIPRGRFLPPSERAGTDARFDQIIDRAMQTDREHRYQSAQEIREDLDRIFTTALEESPSLTERAPTQAVSAAKESAPTKGKRWLIPAVLAGVAVLGIGGYLLRPGAGAKKSEAVLQSATKEHPFVNSLGMKFVPVPETKVLFCIHDTRKGDYRKYADAKPGVDSSWKNVKSEIGDLPVSEGEDHPVVMVSKQDAQDFCQWLSAEEGRTYRLPEDVEWSWAVGLGELEDATASPQSKNKVIKGYPWAGSGHHPPEGAGNIADLSLREKLPSTELLDGFAEKYRDGYVTTSPVMSFKPNDLGLYDMVGNVWQWIGDSRYKRGGSWECAFNHGYLLPSCRANPSKAGRRSDEGFRVVLVK